MDIDDFTKSNFLTAEQVIKNPNIPFIITTEGKLVDKEFEGKKSKKLQIIGEFNKEETIIELGKIQTKKIQDALNQKDTKNWIGHQIFFETYKEMAKKGKNAGNLVDRLNIKEVK